jgi:serine O-acetyltransferase
MSEVRSSDVVRTVARRLQAQRDDAELARDNTAKRVPDVSRVLEVLGRLRALVLDQTEPEALESDLEIAHGLLRRLIGEEKASAFLERLPELRQCNALDLEAAYQGDPAADSYAEIIAAYPSVLAVSTYRIAHVLYGLGEPVVARIMTEDAHSKTGIDIHPGATIGCHFFIDHGTGVVIGETTHIGNRVKLYHGVTLGAFSNRKGRIDRLKKRHPTLEDDVTIYPNANVLGGETVIGRGSVIGGNAWITQSVPPFTRVVAQPSHQEVSQNCEHDCSKDWQI